MGLVEGASGLSGTSVSIVIPTFQRAETLRGTLDAALGQTFGGAIEIVVVDDAGGDDATRHVVDAVAARSAGVPVRMLVSQGRGAAAARNAGARVARGDIVLFVDDDIVLPRDGVERFVEALLAHPGACVNGRWVFAPALVEMLGRTPFGRFRLRVEEWVKRGMPTKQIADGVVEPELLTACELAIWAEDFQRIGGFDETFPSAGYEDQDLSVRAREAGLRLVRDSSIICLHDDRRLTRDQFLARLERGASTAVLLWRKHPTFFETRALIRENDAPSRSDPPGTRLKKAFKAAASTRAGSALLDGCARVLERLAPDSRALDRVYWVMTGVAIYRGVRAGLARYGRPAGVA